MRLQPGFGVDQRRTKTVRPSKVFSDGRLWAVAACLFFVVVLEMDSARAGTFDFTLAGETFQGESNTTLIGGVGVRIERRDTDLIAKGHLDRDVCGRGPDGNLYYQTCQGLFREQTFPAQRIANAKGFGNSNFDQGNLNYDQGDVTQSGARVGQDVLITWGDFGFFAKGFGFWDPVNDELEEYYPNYIDRRNVADVGYISLPGNELVRAGGIPTALGIIAPVVGQLGLDPAIVGQLLANPLAIPVLGVRNDSRPCPASRNPSGQPCGIVYGPGGSVHRKRKDSQTLKQIGKGLVLQELNVFGTFKLPGERDLLVKLGRQQIQWGEATIEFFGSLNVANPPDLGNLFRIGGNGLDDFYQATNALSFATSLFTGASISAYYQLEWRPIAAPASGSFFSPLNLGTRDEGQKYVTVDFGQLPHDPEGLGSLVDSPLSAVTNTTGVMPRLRDREPGWKGQFGIQFKYYAERLNNGTDFGVYFARYHSRLPIASFYSTDLGCAKSTTNAAGFARACPNVPLFHAMLMPNDPQGATDDALPLDSARVMLEYPKNIELYGVSFNTTAGEIALQGELAYRPNEPLQVALVDLAFASYGPTLTNCHLAPGCIGSNTGLGVLSDGTVGTYGSSDFVIDANGTRGGYPDTYDAIVGALPSAGRSFPNFVTPYRGGTIGLTPPNAYLRGWEEFKTISFNVGATYVEGNTNLGPRLIGADQIVWLLELGGFWVPDLPPLDRLQLEAPGIQYHASAGADGSGADRSRQACSTNPACSFGPDGLRFNPHQQDLDLYPDELSAGWAVVAQIRYESILPAISLQPQIIFKHDFYHTSPGLASNYIEGRILWDTVLEIRYKSNLSMNIGYRFFAGGGVANQLSDRDEARLFVKYAF